MTAFALMHPDEKVLLSFRRSRNRIRGLREVGGRGFATTAQLARAIGVRIGEVKDIMEGRLPKYRVDLSLVGLGLVRKVVRATGAGFVITAAGLAVLRALEGVHDDTAARTW